MLHYHPHLFDSRLASFGFQPCGAIGEAQKNIKTSLM